MKPANAVFDKVKFPLIKLKVLVSWLSWWLSWLHSLRSADRIGICSNA